VVFSRSERELPASPDEATADPAPRPVAPVRVDHFSLKRVSVPVQGANESRAPGLVPKGGAELGDEVVEARVGNVGIRPEELVKPLFGESAGPLLHEESQKLERLGREGNHLTPAAQQPGFPNQLAVPEEERHRVDGMVPGLEAGGKAMRVVLLLLFVSSPLAAQTYRAGLRGVVQDAGGGVLPGATVTISDESTGFTRVSVANELGQYAFSEVDPSVYTVRAELDGFTPFEQRGLELSVQRFLVLDIRLELGAVRESITVTSASPILENATASQSSSLEHLELETLPTPSRNAFFVSITTPNVIPTGVAQFTRMQDQNASRALSIAGGPRGANNYTLDGVSITDIQNRAVIIPSMEAVEEVKVQASTYDAEMGRTGGGVFNTLHQRGSNDWGGSAMIQTRPDWAVGQLYFAKEAEEPKEEGYYWLYAGSFGGPIVRDKTFFWGAFEGYRTSVTRNAVLTLPTAAEARGDFSQSGVVIYDPLTTRPDPANPGGYIRDPFPGNVIPSDRLNPVGLNLAAYIAARGEGASPRATTWWTPPTSSPSTSTIASTTEPSSPERTCTTTRTSPSSSSTAGRRIRTTASSSVESICSP
jgi:hypothetical protein